jgi:hypothetical protein
LLNEEEEEEEEEEKEEEEEDEEKEEEEVEGGGGGERPAGHTSHASPWMPCPPRCLCFNSCGKRVSPHFPVVP